MILELVDRPGALLPRPVRRRLARASLVGVVLLTACAPQSDGERDAVIGQEVPAAAPAVSGRDLAAPTGVVDSVLPLEEELRRFREDVPAVAALSEGAGSRDELVRRFLEAVEQNHLEALTPLLLTRAEFGWLYYPHTMYTRPPYRLSPELLWFQVQNVTVSGLQQLRSTLAGKPLHARGYRCEDIPKTEGPNRIWSECRVNLAPPAQEPSDVRLFGSVVEAGGVFKLVSLAADL